MSDEHTRKFQCEYYTVYARPNSCFFCDNCNDIFYDYRNGYASPYMWLCDKGNDTEAGMMGKCQHFYEDAEQTENSSEKPNNCELQTIRCPKCGRTDYIRDMEKDMGIKGSHYKYKCINCNTYIKDEPTISKMEQVEPQTCSFSDCDNFKNPDYERCIECKRKQIKLKTEQTEREGE